MFLVSAPSFFLPARPLAKPAKSLCCHQGELSRRNHRPHARGSRQQVNQRLAPLPSLPLWSQTGFCLAGKHSAWTRATGGGSFWRDQKTGRGMKGREIRGALGWAGNARRLHVAAVEEPGGGRASRPLRMANGAAWAPPLTLFQLINEVTGAR